MRAARVLRCAASASRHAPASPYRPAIVEEYAQAAESSEARDWRGFRILTNILTVGACVCACVRAYGLCASG